MTDIYKSRLSIGNFPGLNTDKTTTTDDTSLLSKTR